MACSLGCIPEGAMPAEVPAGHKQGRIQPVSLGRVYFSDIWHSSLITGSLLQERWSLFHNTAV